MKQIQGKQGLVRDIGRFGKPRVREIGRFGKPRVRDIGRFGKPRARDIGIPLYIVCIWAACQTFSTQTNPEYTEKNSRTVDSKKYYGTRYETVHDASTHRLLLLVGVSRQVLIDWQ